MTATSIHIRPCILAHSHKHNNRIITPDYVRQDLMINNEKYIRVDNLNERLEEIKSLYQEKVKQRLHKKMTPIREGVIVIDEHTTIEQLKNFGKECYSKWGIEPLQIYIHRDEGHYEADTGEWKPNYHAHIVFDWQNKNTGKSIKLSKQDMSTMQTLLAENINMDRGEEDTGIKYVDHIMFKIQKEKEKLELLQKQNKAILDTLEENARKSKELEEKIKKIEDFIFKSNSKIKENENIISKQAEKFQNKQKEIKEVYRKQQESIDYNNSIIDQLQKEILELENKKENIAEAEYTQEWSDRDFRNAFDKMGEEITYNMKDCPTKDKWIGIHIFCMENFLSMNNFMQLWAGWKIRIQNALFWWSDKNRAITCDDNQKQKKQGIRW